MHKLNNKNKKIHNAFQTVFCQTVNENVLILIIVQFEAS
jgi:hypothetical protein